MLSTDLSIPIYLNQQVVFDLLAVLDDGFSRLSTIKTSANESEANKYGMGASIGVSNVFALLGMSFSGDRSKEKGSQDQTEISQEKVHTPTSLFAKLRLKLQELNLVRSIDSGESLKELTTGEFVEFKSLLRKNPLVETMESFKQIMEMAVLFQNENTAVQKGIQSKSRQAHDPNAAFMKQIDGLLAALNQSNSIELVGELLDAPEVRAVITARPDFFSQGTTAEIIDGEFRILGKITRVIASDSTETINLLRKTTFGRFDHRLFDQFSQAFANAETAGLRHAELITEIQGPALLVIPVAIFT